ncbi:MAG: type II toxin-antitoxin system HicB family antitoxin [Acidobacteria bacterium]|nr:MAG: type II toxin-antitoxin system HicB family antitoxin [Acidobacteriota bacterium]
MAAVSAQKGLCICVEREADGRWIAAAVKLPGALAYGESQHDAEQRLRELVFRILADRVAHGEPVPEAANALFYTR